MNIPENSFIGLIEYNDPMIARVSWIGIDSGDTTVVFYDHGDHLEKLAKIQAQQRDASILHTPDERRAYLRGLCGMRP